MVPVHRRRCGNDIAGRFARLAWCLGLLLSFVAVPAVAQETLLGRKVELRVLTYDDPAAPIFASSVYSAQVGDGPEYGLVEEGTHREMDIVPVLIDIGSSRIVLDYSTAGSGWLTAAAFNGYELDFGAECPLFRAAHIDASATSLPLRASDVFFEGGRLYVNVSGMSYQPTDRITVEVVLNDCR